MAPSASERCRFLLTLFFLLGQAWLYKTQALHGLGRHDEALAELEPLMHAWGAGNEQIRGAYEKATFEVKKRNRADYYALFGLPTVCSEMEIKKQYVRARERCGLEWSGRAGRAERPGRAQLERPPSPKTIVSLQRA